MIVKCDVLVVGAGCAGSVAALKLGKEGFNVVLIERESKVGGHTEPKFDISEDSGLGGILGELNLPYSEKTGRSSWFSRDYSFTLESKVSDLYFKRGPLSDCFEVQVVKKAVDSGVQLFLGSELSNFKINGTSIDSVKLSSKNDDVTLEPKVVIAADGFNSGMAGKMGLHVLRDTAEIVGYGIMGLNFNMPPA